ncbi:molybdenum cofactor guanylyltransferase MobA [Frigidibacter oleivorans]|uniref:molybdenum cofactor guanylyltransferase MobA n=1 Tax=Frigidibacter oleivorans TaxID=2487129 RepID=UPI000F8C73BD|nr:molybdenum cofactor guanylyltransferase MobA [Frigidibacter oleivorans]
MQGRAAGPGLGPEGEGESGPVAGVILAGGLSSRMGADKALAMLGGQRLLDRVARRLAPQVARMAVNTNAPLTDPGLPVLPDALPPGVPDRPGPLAGILAALDWAAAEGFARVVTVPVDTPFLPADLVARLAAAGCPAIAESGGRTHPAAGLWPVRLAPALRAALVAGQRRVAPWAEAAGAVRVTFAGDPDPFLNLNTPEDLARAEALLAGQGAGR